MSLYCFLTILLWTGRLGIGMNGRIRIGIGGRFTQEYAECFCFFLNSREYLPKNCPSNRAKARFNRV